MRPSALRRGLRAARDGGHRGGGGRATSGERGDEGRGRATGRATSESHRGARRNRRFGSHASRGREFRDGRRLGRSPRRRARRRRLRRRRRAPLLLGVLLLFPLLTAASSVSERGDAVRGERGSLRSLEPRLFPGVSCAPLGPQFLDAVGVSQGVERVFARPRRGRDVGDHHRSTVAHERVSEHLGEFRSAEGNVAAAAIERADALFQREERLVDLGALYARLPVVLGGVRAALGPREVDERELAVDHGVVRALLRGATLGEDGRRNVRRALLLPRLERELHDGVRPGRLRVGAGGSRAPRGRAVLDELLHQIHVIHLELLQPHHAHLRPRVLANHQFTASVEQVVHLPAVNLKERHPQRQPLVSGSRELRQNLTSRARRKRTHRVRLPRARLTVGEARHLTPVEDGPDERRHGGGVNLVVAHVLGVRVVEREFVRLGVPGQVHLRPGFPDGQFRRRLRAGAERALHRDDVLLVARQLAAIQRTLTNDDANARLVRGRRRQRRSRRRRRRRRLVRGVGGARASAEFVQLVQR